MTLVWFNRQLRHHIYHKLKLLNFTASSYAILYKLDKWKSIYLLSFRRNRTSYIWQFIYFTVNVWRVPFAVERCCVIIPIPTQPVTLYFYLVMSSYLIIWNPLHANCFEKIEGSKSIENWEGFFELFFSSHEISSPLPWTASLFFPSMDITVYDFFPSPFHLFLPDFHNFRSLVESYTYRSKRLWALSLLWMRVHNCLSHFPCHYSAVSFRITSLLGLYVTWTLD